MPSCHSPKHTYDKLRRQLLRECRVDDVGAYWIISETRATFPKATEDELKTIARNIVRDLLQSGKVQAGTLDGPGFRPFDCGLDAVLARLVDEWDEQQDVAIADIIWFVAPRTGLAKGIDREVLRKLLRRWQKKQIDERAVHETSEEIFDQCQSPEYLETNPGSIAIEVLANLEILNHQLIIPEDIPAILEFLDTPKGREAQAWEKWKKYWDNLDMRARQRKLAGNPYYSQLEI